jgi:TorA maturation chaperone TorD
MMELFRALAVLAEPPTKEAARVAQALELVELPSQSEYTDLFVFQLYPYASVYLGREGMLGGDARDLVAGFWRALGQTPPAEADHLSVMLALYARLVELEKDESDAIGRERWRGARKAFLWEHLLSWLPAYLAKVDDIATPFYKRWSELLRAALFEEARAVGRQEKLSLHLRESFGVVDPRDEETGEFLQSLLAPARSGMILVRSDLSRAAHRLKLGLRMGERQFILKTLFSQDADGMLDWLVEEAEDWATRHGRAREILGETAAVWQNKAAATVALLSELKITAKEIA